MSDECELLEQIHQLADAFLRESAEEGDAS